jgi:hypothetical protein
LVTDLLELKADGKNPLRQEVAPTLRTAHRTDFSITRAIGR